MLWIRAIQIERNALAPSLDYTSALSKAMTAFSQYALTDNEVYAERAAAYVSLAKLDYSKIPSRDALIHPIEQLLHIAGICTSLPAYQAAINTTVD